MRRKYVLIPLVWGSILVGLATTLLVVGARSPYTHTNLDPAYNSGYSRTTQTLVGSPVPFPAPVGSVPAGDPVAEGTRLYVALRCASCHGLRGEGAVVGPPIAGSDAKALQKKVTDGPGGMPSYSLTDDQIAAIAAYLEAIARQNQGQ